MLAIAGKLIADTVPLTTSRTMTIQRSAVPLITRNATIPWVAADITLETCSTRVRGNRSATTPPKSRNSTIGAVRAASTCPRAAAESVMSSTANASATPAIIEPRVLLKREAKYHAKLAWRSGANDCRQLMPGRPSRTASR